MRELQVNGARNHDLLQKIIVIIILSIIYLLSLGFVPHYHCALGEGLKNVKVWSFAKPPGQHPPPPLKLTKTLKTLKSHCLKKNLEKCHLLHMGCCLVIGACLVKWGQGV